MKMIKLVDMIVENFDGDNLTSDDYEEIGKRFGKNRECSFHKDEKGYYCKTHRTRSESYKTIKDIPMKEFNFVSSTS